MAAVPDMWSVGISVPTLGGSRLSRVGTTWTCCSSPTLSSVGAAAAGAAAGPASHVRYAVQHACLYHGRYRPRRPDLRRSASGAGHRTRACCGPRPRWGWWSWDDWDEERRPSTGVAPLTSWTVEIIWTLGQAQQKGLAHRLLEQASRVVDQPIASFGWRRPFTPSGEAFVRRLCPEGSGCRISRQPSARVSRQPSAAVSGSSRRSLGPIGRLQSPRSLAMTASLRRSPVSRLPSPVSRLTL